MDFIREFLAWFNSGILIYFLVLNVTYIILVAISFFYVRSQIKLKKVYDLTGLFTSKLYLPVSILTPAYNEEANIIASVRALLQLEFPEFQVVVINDGSTDNTMQKLIDHYKLARVDKYYPLIINHQPVNAVYESELFPELTVIDKKNGRKADALNAGLNIARYDLVCSIDADSILEPDVLKKMLRAFMEDEETVAVGGIVRVANGCTFSQGRIQKIDTPKTFLGRIQVVEYLRAFLFGRVGWDYLNSLLIISGAFGIFDRRAVMRTGGYVHDTVGEDMELVIRLHHYYRSRKIPYKIRFLAEPVCWTEVPEDIATLSRQRNRWQRGLSDSLWRHRRMMFNPKYGRLGFLAMPFFVIFEMLGPVIEFLGWIAILVALLIGAISWPFFFAFLAAAVFLGMILSLASVLCEEFTFRRYPKTKHVLILSLYAFFENFGYRQLHTWWRLRGMFDFVRGRREWGTMERKGLDSGT
ncbi:MAG: glycosyltransferase family 2 protein [Balneolaceae bacterium]|nr:MAG: glycosyltransferase family 2 protein [Balneolaceae bacterium]